MPTGSDTPLPRPFTLKDIHVGSRLYPVLVQHAASRPGQAIYYGELLAQAKIQFPDDDEVKRAVPIGIGMKLLFVEAFCMANAYPNLACLAVNKGRQIPGKSYPGDWLREMEAVAAFDWSTVRPVLDTYVAQAVSVATPLVKCSEKAARDRLFAHFRANRSAYEAFQYDDREEMVNLLMAGIDIVTALRTVLDAQAALEEGSATTENTTT